MKSVFRVVSEVFLDSNTFLDIFSDIIKKHGDDIACIFDEKKISYSELDDLSSNLAKRIVVEGIEPSSVIALGLYNDTDLVSSLLAIWKAGCIYLPIDPNYPIGRIDAMMQNACPKLLITKNGLQDKFPSFKGRILFIDEKNKISNVKLRTAVSVGNKLNSLEAVETKEVESIVGTAELRTLKPEDLAYLMYTSGSTGAPKGILVDHLALKHSAIAYNELHPERYIALVAGSISFDPSLLTIVSILAKGGTLCLYDNKDGIDLSNIQCVIEIIEKKSVNFVLSTPSFYLKLMKQNRDFFSLKNVDLCGEDFSENLVDLHAKFAPNATLHNTYGPTEYAMGVTAGIIYDPKEKKKNRITMGKPFSCNKIYLLDANLNQIKSGEKGALLRNSLQAA